VKGDQHGLKEFEKFKQFKEFENGVGEQNIERDRYRFVALTRIG
jgi:hypothetical protein